MFVKQISVFLENRPGRLEELTTLFGKSGVDLIALSIADTSDFGILRGIADDSEKAYRIAKENGYNVGLISVIAVVTPDEPDGLARVLRILKDGEISIEYLYSLVRRVGNEAVIILRVNKPDDAVAVLIANGIKLLDDNSIK
ncbi:MAG: acetolactate synthase [Clostridiales bacterium]|nr:acetolactate synthase [Clostridiales bacterium]